MSEVIRPTGKELKKYIVDNLDRAIEEGWITAFYQPVVRTLTNEICGLEALARWIDPVYGIFPPYDFIGALEEAKLIHKLDSHIIHIICADYADSQTRDISPVTVSFNLSRLDFKLMDVHEIIETEMKAYNVPRESLRVEITESMMDNNEEYMHDVIDRFWDRGLRVWMDDFGSGYSSLNVLKDYRFDTLKIDMVFLRDFNAKSMEIVKSIVDMSKRIGVHTLAEGVETLEQLDFLRSIGCEKAQGYYIGKPMSYDDGLVYLKSKGYQMEAPEKRRYYHDIGKVNILSAMPMLSVDKGGDNKTYSEEQIPLAFVEYSGDKLRYLFANHSYIETINRLGSDSLEAIEDEFNKGESPLRDKFLSMLIRAKETNEVVGVDFIRESRYCYAQVRAVAGYPGGNAYLCLLTDVSDETLVSRGITLDRHMRSLCSIYEMITLVDLNTGYSKTIFSTFTTKHDYNLRPAAEELKDYSENQIYPDDAERFVRFTDLTTIEQRIQDSPTRHISAPFRTLTGDGKYIWALYSYLFDGEKSDRKIFCCFRRLAPEAVARISVEAAETGLSDEIKAEEIGLTPDILWKNFCNNSNVGFFWKDNKRRFVGVNRKFMEYYDLTSEEQIIGKTDEDMGWHVDPEPFKNDEESVLRGEGQTYMVPGTCICKGEIRNILASKMPLYVDGKIAGLVGFFLDVTDQKSRDTDIKYLMQTDEMTGTMNFLGMMEALLRYQDAYAMYQSDFAMIFINISHFKLFAENYGHEWCRHLLKNVAAKLQKIIGVEGIAGRLFTDNFMVVRQFEKSSEITGLIDEIQREIEGTQFIEGVSCSVCIYTGCSFFSETRDLQVMYEETVKRLRENNR
ncbi:MAG: EAL domain-containing protein [Lachnospiraceae bacterium]|nr:EAL domain-containing protein [Lachnospiraceae bacterium]